MDVKIQIRSARASVTKVVNELNTMLLQSSIDASELETLKYSLERKNDRLSELNKQFQASMESLTDSELQVEIDKIEEYNDKVDVVLAKVKVRCNCINASSASTKPTFVATCKLPKLDLPCFYGDVLTFQDFIESFKAAVDANPISPKEKLNYLRSKVKGEAAELISGLELSDMNYNKAMKLLEERYGSRKRLQRAHLRAFFSYDCSNAKDVKSYRAFVDGINKHIRGLESLNLQPNEYSTLLCEILIDKVPNRVKHDWAELDEDDMDLEHLLHLVETEAKKLDIVISTTCSNSSDNSKLHKLYDKPQYKSRINAHAGQVSTYVPHCFICTSTDHKAYGCPQLVNSTVDKRFELVKKHGLCENCLWKHDQTNCRNNQSCKVCNKRHHTLLHFNSSKDDSSSTTGCISFLDHTDCLLPVTSIPLFANNATISCGALLDSGSQRSFIQLDKLKAIDCTVKGSIPLNINGFGGSVKENCTVVEIYINFNGEKMPINVIATRNFRDIKFGNHVSHYDKLKCRGLSPIESFSSIDILIGSDYFYRFVTGSQVKLSPSLCGIETVFGWTIHGKHSNRDLNFNCDCSNFNISFDNIPECFSIEKFWDNELTGILPIEDCSTECNSEILRNFNHDISSDSAGRYIVRFPWIKKSFLSSSYEYQCKIRLHQTIKRLVKDHSLHEYDNIIKEYLHLGIIEEASPECNTVMRYLPHHGVVKRDRETTKVRIVFDASSKNAGEKSLNDCLHEGPNLFPSIVGILIRFRLFPFAMCADIEKAFLQVGLHVEDRDCFRFFWFKENLDNSWPTENEIPYRFTRVCFGAKSSPFLLNATIKYHLDKCEEVFPSTCRVLRNSLYVDDLILSTETSTQINQLRSDAIEIFSSMKMNMHKWKTNCTVENHSYDINPIVSILGMIWSIDNDTLCVKFPEDSEVSNKRQLTGLICSLFDPLGFYSPLVIRLKLILQDIWQSKLGWDDILPENTVQEINSIQDDVKLVNSFELSRHIGIFDLDNSEIELHGFADASQRAYSACVYIRILYNGKYLMKLMTSKSRLAPKRTLTLPRLELMGCLITARLLHVVMQEINLKIKGIYCWTDSRVALCWIKGSDKVYKQFVENRVVEIRRLQPESNWFHIPGNINPADFATKPFPAKKWLHSNIWWGGPDVHMLLANCNQVIDIDNETLKCINKDVHSFVSVNSIIISEPIINFENFSSYLKILKIFCVILSWRYRHDCKSHGEYKFSHIKRSEQALFAYCQKLSFPNEYMLLMNDCDIPNNSRIKTFNPYIDEYGVIRSNSRLSQSNISYDSKFPIILDNKCHLTKLLIAFYHHTMAHAGCSFLLSTLRKRFMILQLRRTVRNVIYNCLKCKRFKITPLEQPFAPLVSDRVSYDNLRSFECTGLDYAGPFYLTASKVKYYILLFTCMKVRAIHLEVTNSLDTPNFLKAFTRFKARRGCPSIIRSDNAKTFKKASVTLALNFGIQWLFNTELAPWTGGVWERLVRTVKSCLRIVIKSYNQSKTDFETCLCLIEEVINKRPITYHTGMNDDILPLSPWNFLIIPCSDDPHKTSNNSLSKCFSENNKLVREFWCRWKNEYLPTLITDESKNCMKNIKPGDVVLVNEGTKREYWPLGRVIEVLLGRDNVVRSVKLKCRNKTIVRPTKLLHILESNC